MAVHVLALTVDLRLPACHSLKDKRAVVRTIVEGARHRFSVASAETGHQDSWQRAELGFAVVSGTVAVAEEVMAAVDRFVWSFPEVEVLSTAHHWTDTG